MLLDSTYITADCTTRRRRCGFVLLLAAPLFFAGCAGETIEYTEVKRIDEKVTEPELLTLLEIISRLPTKRVPELPPLFAPAPHWDEDRTLPVNELVEEEQRLMEDRHSVESLAARLYRDRTLQRLLRREHMTPEQFVGLVTAIGVALSCDTLRDDQDLDHILERGERALEDLQQNTSRFSSLRPDERHGILQQAIWITRLDRARRLKMVPPENLALAREHADVLVRVLPEEFSSNPLDAVVDYLEERGIPFEELSQTGSDAAIEWSREEARYGTDKPDPELKSNDVREIASGPMPL